MRKLVIIGGLTASGKTKAAIETAHRFNGELINADSRQVYKLLNIGTNKGNLKEFEKNNFKIEDVPIHLVNIINPDQRFSVFEFQKLAFEKIEEILNRDKLPILVGGTGLYIDSIVKRYKLVGNENLSYPREKLNKLSIAELQEILNASDSQLLKALNESDSKNPRRLIRLIEKIEKSKTEYNPTNITNPDLPIYESLFLYPQYDWESLKIKIENRVEEMFKEGIVEETKVILDSGYSPNDPGLQIMGYSQVVKYLKGEFDLEKTKELIKFAHKQYAKRQKTWFEGKGRNYNLKKLKSTSEAINLTLNFLEK